MSYVYCLLIELLLYDIMRLKLVANMGIFSDHYLVDMNFFAPYSYSLIQHTRG